MKKQFVILLSFLLLVIIVACFFIFSNKINQKHLGEAQILITNFESDGQVLKAHLVSLDGTITELTTSGSFSNFGSMAKRPYSQRVFFTNKLTDDRRFFVKNLSDNLVAEYMINIELKSDINLDIRFDLHPWISPDDSQIIYYASFYSDCPYGNCAVIKEEGIRSGYYLYDLDDGSNTYLTDLSFYPTYNSSTNKLYFVTHDQGFNPTLTYKIKMLNLDTKQISTINNVIQNNIEYGVYGSYLTKSNAIIMSRYTKIDEPLFLYDLDTRITKILYHSNDPDFIKPLKFEIDSIFSISPNESKFLYSRRPINDGPNTLFVFNFRSAKHKQIVFSGDCGEYLLGTQWLDENHFVTVCRDHFSTTKVDRKEEDLKRYLVFVDLINNTVNELANWPLQGGTSYYSDWQIIN